MDDILNRGLPKWSGLLVSGEPVTTDQAAEILFRTFYFGGSCNDREWMKEVSEALGIPLMTRNIKSTEEFFATLNGIEKFHKDHNRVEVEFLAPRQVWSSWVGGPHGWLDWDGQVHSACYNIGKWPSVESVAEEWETLAKAFPFLDLTCQLIDNEISTDKPVSPVVEYRVKGGEITVLEPGPLLLELENIYDEGSERCMAGEESERGCTIEQLLRGKALAARN